MVRQRLPAEWEPQDAILLVWPHKNTEWNENLSQITQLYEALVSVVCDFSDVVIALPEIEIESVRVQLEAMLVPLEYVYFCPVETHDTWVRDYGPFVVENKQGMLLLNFIFNAYGGKYDAVLDKKITENLYLQRAFPAAEFENQDWVLEGGSIEVDGQGTLLTTKSCLLNKNRNPDLSQAEIEIRLKNSFGVNKINWLENGYLLGDSTDGHINNLARLCPNNVIIYTACDDEQDEHYIELKKMEAELSDMTNAQGERYTLKPLPWPGVILGNNDNRLPASYANFLIVNEAVLVPIYDALSDEDALEVVSQVFPGFEIMGIPCITLLERGGSLHRITKPLPEGTLMSI